MPVIYTENDADLEVLRERPIAIIDYTELGRSTALNLRDNGFYPMIGALNENRAARARSEGFEVAPPGEAAHKADLRLLMLPDEQVAEAYLAYVAPSLRAGDMIVFASGYNVAFGFVEPPPFVDAVMIAPRAFGGAMREKFLTGEGFLSYVCVEQDATGKAWERLLALAGAMGALKLGALEVTMRQESEMSQFIDQALMPALHHLITSAVEILIREGYPPEAALLDVYVSSKLSESMERAAQEGMIGFLRDFALITQYGMLSRIDRFQDPKQRRQFELILEEIRKGKFAQEWTNEYHNGFPQLEAMRTKRANLPVWRAESDAIEMLRQAKTRRKG